MILAARRCRQDAGGQRTSQVAHRRLLPRATKVMWRGGFHLPADGFKGGKPFEKAAIFWQLLP